MRSTYFTGRAWFGNIWGGWFTPPNEDIDFEITTQEISCDGFAPRPAPTGGIGGPGSPIGLLLALTQAEAADDTGESIGLLLALTKSQPAEQTGQPTGLLLLLTKAA